MSERAIENFINKKPILVSSYTSLESVLPIMKSNQLSHLLVTGGNYEPLGVLCKKTVNSFRLSPRFAKLTCEQVMQKEFLSFEIDTPLRLVVDSMVKDNQPCSVITHPSKKVIGLFTLVDALKAFHSCLSSDLKVG